MFADDSIPMPIDGILDLHTFQPSEIGDLIPDYIEACRESGIFEIRIIHGKGIGELRRSVQAILDRNPNVLSYSTPQDASSWGATSVSLKKPS